MSDEADRFASEDIKVEFAALTLDETLAEIVANDAAVFITADGFGFWKGERLPLLPSVEIDRHDWIEEAVLTKPVICEAFGIGRQIEGADVPLFVHFQLVIDGKYAPLYIFIDKAPQEWVGQAMRRFVVVWPEREDGQRVYMASGPMTQHLGGVVLPPRTRRNDVCPCGSGVKFKRCCGA